MDVDSAPFISSSLSVSIRVKVYWAFDLYREDYSRDYVREFVLTETGVDMLYLPTKI